MTREEAIYCVKDICERYKSIHKTYPSEIWVTDVIWKGLVTSNHLFPPHQQPTVAVPLFSLGASSFTELQTMQDELHYVKVHPEKEEEESMSKQSFPKITSETRTTIDLKVIEQQLDVVERALMASYHHFTYAPCVAREGAQQIADALDTLLTIKKSFGMRMYVNPVQERESAVIDHRTSQL